jgi:hypothetical protein
MKKYVIFCWVLGATAGFAQNTSGLLFGNLRQPVDINACYQATPGLVMHAETGQVLFQSTNGGTSWMDLGKTLPAGTEVNFLLPKDGGIYLGTRNGELYYNTDAQSGNWVLQTIEGKTTDGFVTGIYAGVTGTYVSIWQEGLFKLVPGTNTWKLIPGALEKQSLFNMVESPDGVMLVAGELGIYQSKNGGISWNQVYAKGWVNSLAYVSNVWIAQTHEGVIRSVDDGLHWSLVVPEVAANFHLSVIDGYFVAIRNTGTQNSAQQNYSNILLSIDGGNSWKEMDAGKPANSQVFDLEKSGNHLFSSRKAGISRSADLGKTWQLLLAPPVNNNNLQFELVVINNTLFAYLKPLGC